MIDQFNDPSFKTLASRLRESPEFREHIKTASLDLDEVNSLPDTAFAWEDMRRYPFHTPEHAALSYMYATSKTASVPSHVVTTLERALEVYDIELAPTKVASAPVVEEDDSYILPEYKRWSVSSVETLKLAEAALQGEGKALRQDQRRDAAKRLVKKAKDLGVDPTTHTLKTANYVASDLGALKDQLLARAELTARQGAGDYKKMYEKLAESLDKVEPISYDELANAKLAEFLAEKDENSGISKYYGKSILDWSASVYNTTKLAEPTVDMAGRSVPLSKLASIPMSTYEDVLGKDYASEMSTNGSIDFEKLSAIMPTVPLDLKSILLKFVR